MLKHGSVNDQLTDMQTDMRGHREITLQIINVINARYSCGRLLLLRAKFYTWFKVLMTSQYVGFKEMLYHTSSLSKSLIGEKYSIIGQAGIEL